MKEMCICCKSEKMEGVVNTAHSDNNPSLTGHFGAICKFKDYISMGQAVCSLPFCLEFMIRDISGTHWPLFSIGTLNAVL